MTVLAGVLILLGIAGAVLPFLPGPPLAFAGLLIYGFATDFEPMSATVLVVFGFLILLTLALDVVAPAIGAKGYKASRWGIIGSFVGAIFGIFVMGPLGIILGPFVGGFVGEFLHLPDSKRALRTAWGSFVGFLMGTLVRLGVTLGMAGYFVYALIKH